MVGEYYYIPNAKTVRLNRLHVFTHYSLACIRVYHNILVLCIHTTYYTGTLPDVNYIDLRHPTLG